MTTPKRKKAKTYLIEYFKDQEECTEHGQKQPVLSTFTLMTPTDVKFILHENETYRFDYEGKELSITNWNYNSSYIILKNSNKHKFLTAECYHN